METCTPGITAPEASVTVPESVAPVTCARASGWGRKMRTKTKQTRTTAQNRSENNLRIVASSGNYSIHQRPLGAEVARKTAGKRGTEVTNSFSLFLRGVYLTE